MMHTMYVQTGLLYEQDYQRSLKQDDEHAQIVDKWFDRLEQRNKLDDDINRCLDEKSITDITKD